MIDVKKCQRLASSLRTTGLEGRRASGFLAVVLGSGLGRREAYRAPVHGFAVLRYKTQRAARNNNMVKCERAIRRQALVGVGKQ